MKFKIIYQLSVMSFLSLSSFAQIVLNGGAKIVFNGGTLANNVFVVLNTPPAVPITTSGATDGVIMEAEYNRLQYNLATATTAITVPYMSTLLEQIPFTLTPTAAGTGAGNIRFSGRVAATRATGFDNATYMPSDVLNMGAIPGIANNSAKTIDRFWIIDANAYTTKPAVTLNFSYIDAEWAANGGNAITEGNLRAQRFNSTIGDWGGYTNYVPAGVINTGANTVSGVVVSAADFFRSWTLNDKSVPLPIELLNFDATCINKETVLEWCTASEKNNSYYTIEQSADGVNFNSIGTVQGNGNTETKHCYKFITGSGVADLNYYRLKQTDYDNTSVTYKIVSLEACDHVLDNIIITNNATKQVGIILNSSTDSRFQLYVYTSLGQIIDMRDLEVKKGFNNIQVELNNVSNAVYYISINNNTEKLISKKIIISDIGN